MIFLVNGKGYDMPNNTKMEIKFSKGEDGPVVDLYTTVGKGWYNLNRRRGNVFDPVMMEAAIISYKRHISKVPA